MAASFGLILFLVILVEGLIEHFGAPLPDKAKPYAAAVLGMLLCLAYGADLPALLGFDALWPYIGSVLTGLVISRGSNYVNDLISRLRGEVWAMPVPAPPPPETGRHGTVHP